MEGLHHDTNLDPISPVPDDSPKDKGDSQTIEVNPHNPSSSNKDNFVSAPINQSLTAEEKLSCMTKWLGFVDLRNGHCVLTNKDILGGFYIFTLGKRQWQ